MGRKASVHSVPTAWVDVIRHHWHHIHTVQVAYRASPNGPWQLAYTAAIPDEVDGDKMDASIANSIASDAWDAAWEHLEEIDAKRCDYKIQAYEQEDSGSLALVGESGQGGRLTPGAESLENAGTDEEGHGQSLVSTLMKERKDMVAEHIRMVRAGATNNEKIAELLQHVGDLIKNAGDGRAREAEAKSEADRFEAKMDAATQLGIKYLEQQGPVWAANAERKARTDGESTDANLQQLCRAAAMSIDAPTAMKWKAAGMDWEAVTAVLHKAGQSDDWERQVKKMMLQLETQTEIFKLASATCTAAFKRVAEKIGITLG